MILIKYINLREFITIWFIQKVIKWLCTRFVLLSVMKRFTKREKYLRVKLTIQYFWKLFSTFYEKHWEKPIIILVQIDYILLLVKHTVKFSLKLLAIKHK